MDNTGGDWSEAGDVFLSLAESLTSSNVEAGQGDAENQEKLAPEKWVVF